MARYTDSRTLIQYALRGLAFIFAVISASLYGADLASWTRTNTSADSRWIYAEVVAVLAALSSIAQCRIKQHRSVTALWSSVIFLLWLVTVAVLGQVAFQREKVEGGYSLVRLKAAVIIDVVNMALWLASAVELCLCCHIRRKDREQGNAEVVEQENMVEIREVGVPEDHLPAYEEVCDVEAPEPTQNSFLDGKGALKSRCNESETANVPA